jgi:hypothetical protein
MLRPRGRRAGQGAVPEEGDDPKGSGEASREAAHRIAASLAPLLRDARAAEFQFLAYLLGMALKESRRLAEGRSGT